MELNKPQFNIRVMSINDYEQVYSLWINTEGMGLNNIDDSKEGIEKYLNRNPTTCFVAEQDEMIIGAIMSGHDGRRGYIHHTAVAQSFKKKGIGAKLVSAAMSALKREGITKIALVAFAENETGNLFWEKLGFTQRNDLVYRNKAIVDLVRLNT